MRKEYKYIVGTPVKYKGKVVPIVARSHNVNGNNIYQIAGTWVPEHKVIPFLEPPCPV